MAALRILFLITLVSAAGGRAAELAELWAERVKTVVAVEFYIETEMDRRPTLSYGTVIDRQGTIILPGAAVSVRIAPDQLKEFKVYVAGEAASQPAEYLGQDTLTGWHFIRASEKLRERVVPITAFAAPPGTPSPVPGMAEEVWGIGLRNKDEDFAPYILVGKVALIQSLPQRTAIAMQDVGSPGLPVFNRDGVFVGLAASSFGHSYIQFSRNDRGGLPVMLVNVEESSAFPLAEEILPHLTRIPENVFGRPLAWVGVYGLEPIDPEVAKFLKLDAQGAVVVSEVLPESPAQAAGMQDRDIIVALGGQLLPRLKPDRVVVNFVEREIAKRRPGDVMNVTVLRGVERQELRLVLADEPKLIREAQRKYFERIGVTVREFVYGDAILRRVTATNGVVAHFVKSNSPVAIAGLRTDDWIKEIDGTEVATFAEAVEKLAAIEADRDRIEFVLLTSRGGDTAVLRVKLR